MALPLQLQQHGTSALYWRPQHTCVTRIIPARPVTSIWSQRLIAQSLKLKESERKLRVACKNLQAEDSTSVSGEEPSSSANSSRRTLQVTFTCNKCGARTQRAVNPVAWDAGTVFAQCDGCEVWHKLRDEANLIDEITYEEESSYTEESSDGSFTVKESSSHEESSFTSETT